MGINWPSAVWLGFLSLSLATNALAAPVQQPLNDCPLGIRDTRTLDPKILPSAKFRMRTDVGGWDNISGKQVELTLRHGEETADLKNGVKLRVTLGWCEDYSNEYEFTLSEPPPRNADTAFWLRKASDLLAEIAPANLDQVVPVKKLAVALARRATELKVSRAFPKDGLEGQFEHSDNAPTYTVRLEQRAGRTILTVGYGVPL